ncbi:DinB family protein, partial [Aegicerativicinus sediminis]
MKQIRLSLVLALLTLTCYSVNNPNTISKNESASDGGSLLGGTKTYTLELAEAMPADSYTLRPTDSVRSFGEQLAHIAISTQFLVDVLINDKPMPTPEEFGAAAKMEKEIGADKAKCIAMLKESMDALDAKFASMT